jgi:hypothetical protein
MTPCIVVIPYRRFKTTLKSIGAQQATSINNDKNTKYKLLKTKAALWYNISFEHTIKFFHTMTQ